MIEFESEFRNTTFESQKYNSGYGGRSDKLDNEI